MRKGELYMGFFEKILNFLNVSFDEAPSFFGVFHVVSLILLAALTFLLCKKFSGADDKTLRRLTFVLWIVILVLEIYKQMVYTIRVENGIFSADYEWYAFPFQFCSSPLYVLPFIAFLPSGRARDCFIGFMGTFSLFAGLCVMIYPGDVFVERIGIDVQTMIHHGTQVALGIFYTVHYFRHQARAERRRFYLGSIAVFGALLTVAMILNISVHAALVSQGINETFNMFFVSPYFDCTLPVLSVLSPIVPYPVFLLVYMAGFTLAAGIVFYVSLGIDKLITKRKKAYAI